MSLGVLFIYQFAFWISGTIFTHTMERRKCFGKRFTGFSVGIVLLMLGNAFLLKDAGILLEVLRRCLAYLFMLLFLYGCFDISFSVALYNMVWGVSVWQLLAEMNNVVLQNLSFGEASEAVKTMVCALIFAVGLLSPMFTIAKWMPKERKKQMGPRQITLTLLIFLVINLLAFHKGLQLGASYNAEWKYLYLVQLICIVLLYLEGELFKKSNIRRELEIMNLLYQKEREQYFLAKENIALINQKCHDLKHQIRALRKGNKEELDKYLKEIENSVEIYESIVKTGNEVFDTILTEKSLYCRARQIQVSCVADGSQMDFIDTIDLYTLLGNAMDNAIEAVEQFKEPHKRQIDVMIYRQQHFLVIHVVNPLPGELTYEDGLPVTTKKDRDYHGFGMRSMDRIIKKYEGFFSVSEEDGCFSLKMLIPIPTTKETTT